MDQEPNKTDCETLAELLPAYSVGATDPEETALVERLLPLCPEVAAELDDYAVLVQAMHYTAPAAQPPAALHDRLMAATRTETASPEATGSPAPQLVPKPAASAAGTGIRGVNRSLVGLVGIAAALLIVSNIYWSNQINVLRRQQADTLALIARQQDALASLGTEQAHRVELVSTGGDNQNAVLATVLWSEQTPTALLLADQLPELAPDRAYQLWVIQGEQPVGVGVFSVDAHGVGVLVFNSDVPMTEFNAVAITEEPAGGSEQPTTTPLAAAQI